MDQLTSSFENIRRETGGYPFLARYEVDGHTYGGSYTYDNDLRVRDFVTWTPKESLTNVLELASCEAGQTIQLLKTGLISHVHGLDGKPWLVQRAAMIARLLNLSASFSVCDFDNEQDLAKLSNLRYDSIFCSHLLYHLAKPWNLLKALLPVSEYLFIVSHYTARANCLVNNYHGMTTSVSKQPNAWTGISPTAFWFTLSELFRCLTDCGWMVSNIRDWPKWDPPRDPLPNVEVLCRRR